MNEIIEEIENTIEEYESVDDNKIPFLEKREQKRSSGGQGGTASPLQKPKRKMTEKQKEKGRENLAKGRAVLAEKKRLAKEANVKMATEMIEKRAEKIVKVKANKEKIPPSPRLSARSVKKTYLKVVCNKLIVTI